MGARNVGFTLVELVLVLVIIGLLSAVAIPKAIEMSGEQDATLKKTVSGAVKNALLIAQADLKTYPSLESLALYVQADMVRAVDSGMLVSKGGDHFTVPTFIDPSCTTPTQQLSDSVRCVGVAH